MSIHQQVTIPASPGRQVELVPASRIVQVWRIPEWEPGRYTIVRFTLDASTRRGMFYFAPLTRHFAA